MGTGAWKIFARRCDREAPVRPRRGGVLVKKKALARSLVTEPRYHNMRKPPSTFFPRRQRSLSAREIDLPTTTASQARTRKTRNQPLPRHHKKKKSNPRYTGPCTCQPLPLSPSPSTPKFTHSNDEPPPPPNPTTTIQNLSFRPLPHT